MDVFDDDEEDGGDKAEVIRRRRKRMDYMAERELEEVILRIDEGGN